MKWNFYCCEIITRNELTIQSFYFFALRFLKCKVSWTLCHGVSLWKEDCISSLTTLESFIIMGSPHAPRTLYNGWLLGWFGEKEVFESHLQNISKSSIIRLNSDTSQFENLSNFTIISHFAVIHSLMNM